MDIPSEKSTSGRLTRIFMTDNSTSLGFQISNVGETSFEKSAYFNFMPNITPISLLNGATSGEINNCNILDFGAFLVVNLSGVSTPNWTAFDAIVQLPAFAKCRINQIVRTDNGGQEVIYIDANTREIRLTATSSAIFCSLIIPVVDSNRY